MKLSEWSDNAVQTFKKRFKKLLEDTTVKDAAREIGASVGSVSSWAATNKDVQPSISNLANIASAFKVSPNYLLGYERNESANERIHKLMEYTGLDEITLKALHESRDDIMKGSVLNYILTDRRILDKLVEYFLVELYEEFDEDYKYLPKYNSRTERKYESYDLLEELKAAREQYSKNVRNNKKQYQEIHNKFFDEEVNWQFCLECYIISNRELEVFKRLYKLMNRGVTDDDFLNMFMAIDKYYNNNEDLDEDEYLPYEEDDEADENSELECDFCGECTEPTGEECL